MAKKQLPRKQNTNPKKLKEDRDDLPEADQEYEDNSEGETEDDGEPDPPGPIEVPHKPPPGVTNP